MKQNWLCQHVLLSHIDASSGPCKTICVVFNFLLMQQLQTKDFNRILCDRQTQSSAKF